RTGYDIRDFGGNTFIIKGIPPYMTLTEAERFAKDIMEQQENEVHLHQNAPVVDKLIMHSCKAAVKANDVLSEREIKDLLDSLSKCVNPFSCPHGRPTFIRMSRYELERSFKRK
ncbi:MAG: DNA mismatch repair protein MutL, partial [Eubacteriales bacterium]|nr:DNA mismatch repair protein MutL [Eubacteriales bacterium]